MNRRLWLHACAATAAALHAPVLHAQPAPVRIVIGFAPGGSVDALARLVGEQLQAGLGGTVIVENKTGASGRLAVEAVKAATPDGTTLLLAPQGPMTLFAHIFKRLRYDPAKDFVPVSRVATGDYALSVGPAVPVKDVAGLRQWLQTAGPKATYGSPGAGTLPHFVGVSIARQLGVPMTHVPYRGSTLAIVDLAGGAVATAVTPVTEALELHKAGRIRILATTGAVRSPFLDGVPTLKESGLDVDVPLWYAVYAPAGVPAATVERLRSLIDAGLATPSARERLAKIALVPAPGGGAEMAALQRRETQMWGPIVKASGFTPED